MYSMISQGLERLTDFSPKVSIVTVSYNQRSYLETAILSVLKQTYPNIEYIIMDGGSTDGSMEVVNRYRSRIHYSQSAPDGGAARALNLGFSRASGAIYAYLNSDDFLHPTAVEKWVACFGQHPEADLVYGDLAIVDAAGNPTTVPGRRVSIYKASSPPSRRRMAAGGFTVPQQSCACRREVHLAIGGFNEDNKTCWDGEYYADAAILGMRFWQIKEVLAAFRMHSAGITGGQRYRAALEQDYRRIRSKWIKAGIKLNPLERIALRLMGQIDRAARYATEPPVKDFHRLIPQPRA